MNRPSFPGFRDREKKQKYRVKKGQIFIHPMTGNRYTEGVDFLINPVLVDGQEEKLLKFPLYHRAILSPEIAK